MATVKCPNCEIELRTVLHRVKKNTPRTGIFENTAQGLPIGLPSQKKPSLWWVLFGKGSRSVAPPPVISQMYKVLVESRPTARQLLLREMNIKEKDLSVKETITLAEIYIQKGYSWSKANTVDNSNMTGHKHDKIKDIFLHLLFLTKISDTEYQLSEAGYNYLKYFLGDRLSKM